MDIDARTVEADVPRPGTRSHGVKYWDVPHERYERCSVP